MSWSNVMEWLNWGLGQTLTASIVLSVLTFRSSYHYVGFFIPMFIQKGHYGQDKCKEKSGPVAEPLGVVAAAVYLIFIFVFIGIPFYEWKQEVNTFMPPIRLLFLLAGLVSICTSILLGFADDMLDLRWRHKLIFPFLSSVPLVLVYFISEEKTAMLLPKFFYNFFGQTYLELGVLFYVYIIMLVIFCTNAINIIAGINGVEAGQSIVIAASVALFNLVQMVRLEDDESVWSHLLSFSLLAPFIATSLGLYMHNKYPAKAFVGDTFCYFSGMTLAVVAVIGHFSKTLLLFLIPQVFNFLYSCPQLFHLVPCPRHRLPKFDEKTQQLNMSRAEFKASDIKVLGHLVIKLFTTLCILDYKEFEKDGEKWLSVSNMTILNLLLKFHGPMREYELNNLFLRYQVASSALAFVCRFVIAGFLYENVM
ncbi:unnamed protein product [Bursaphelenchus okinawaensis]|uniref:UDP-N-acetylglucosamine--dolichyl-phosphate N-acetylglucosaminephosphotransferase n=1 Tax=Bursaphelenchus okinawaensis TaxID=465554 RepID=A0A811LAF1_9BILA|nr:unnamed protein product [Bursaphelenchus okinawaensis]CAG9119568.1 unnamed protein product [Bursaphelenchus okinawaensis]